MLQTYWKATVSVLIVKRLLSSSVFMTGFPALFALADPAGVPTAPMEQGFAPSAARQSPLWQRRGGGGEAGAPVAEPVDYRRERI